MNYIPEKGDIIWINFDPQLGHEQAKRRPALVLTPKTYNDKTSLCIVCPLTSKKKGYPFEVNFSENSEESIVLSDQVKSLDWRSRKGTFKSKAPKKVVLEVLSKLLILISP